MLSYSYSWPNRSRYFHRIAPEAKIRRAVLLPATCKGIGLGIPCNDIRSPTRPWLFPAPNCGLRSALPRSPAATCRRSTQGCNSSIFIPGYSLPRWHEYSSLRPGLDRDFPVFAGDSVMDERVLIGDRDVVTRESCKREPWKLLAKAYDRLCASDSQSVVQASELHSLAHMEVEA